MNKPECPYKPKTMLWALYMEDWSDLTVKQISEVFDVSEAVIYKALRTIARKTRYRVPHKAADRSAPRRTVR